MADVFKNHYDFWIDLRLCDLEDYTLLLRFYEISVELTIFRLQYSTLEIRHYGLVCDVLEKGL